MFVCGGTLISPKHVLTAGHCTVDSVDQILPAANLTIGYNHYKKEEQKFANVKKVTTHPQYLPQGLDAKLDIAILELEELEFTKYNQRVPIYDGSIGTNQNMFAVGWGQTEDGAENLSVLRGVLVMTGNKTMCGGESGEFVDNNGPQICTPGALTPYHSICMGDSGSGLLGTSAVPVIKVTGDGMYACGGSIISPKHILTAAHCVVQTKDVVLPATNVTIRYDHYDKDKQKVGGVNKITIHPEYFAQERNGRVDIAILELEDLNFSEFNQRVPIYDGPIGVEQTMLAVGWGQTEDGADNLSVLRGVLVMTGNKTMCGGESGEFVDNNGPQICTPGALTPHHSTCMGDSGSGLLVSSNNTLILVGVDSIAVNYGESECGNTSGFHLFVHASYYMDFIMENTGLSREYLTGLSDS
ncbi:hypothetical protein LPJ66_003166 [Kickxella alabastrina]|uniref:Uncharacterized protein n=1 Tax=Kickxella alabastrina TaxID=61397 RepID=A0ACC1INI3_9FUNG|nr:hypothetical protein LPJ66_003166 [Kickxella alabastrina]